MAGRVLQSTDIICLDNYPIGHYQNPLSVIAASLRQITGASLEQRKPAAFWLQLYGNYDAPREPTVDEQRALSYLAFICGVRLFLYWLYKPMNGALWESLKPLIEEVANLCELVFREGAQWRTLGTQRIHIHYALWEMGDYFLLVACNISDQTLKATFTVEQLAGRRFTSFETWYRSGPTQLADHRLEIQFAPFERQVIKLWQ
jgi:hypothetical protein